MAYTNMASLLKTKTRVLRSAEDCGAVESQACWDSPHCSTPMSLLAQNQTEWTAATWPGRKCPVLRVQPG